jgi:hypothetical protein
MSTRTTAACIAFTEAMCDSGHLMALHSRTGPGRRHHEPSLNRAVAVMTVAAWQSYVELTTKAILDDIAVPPTHSGSALFALVKASTMSGLGRFNTPDTRNTLALFRQVGFDPTAGWSFSVPTRSYTYTSPTVTSELEEWLKVRHTIAHGATLPALAIVKGRTKDGPKLWKHDAEHCIEFFNALVSTTAIEAQRQFP